MAFGPNSRTLVQKLVSGPHTVVERRTSGRLLHSRASDSDVHIRRRRVAVSDLTLSGSLRFRLQNRDPLAAGNRQVWLGPAA